MLKKSLILTFLLLIMPLTSWSGENWSFGKEKNITYSVFETIDEAKWHTFVVCKVNPNEVVFEALIPFTDYKKYFSLNLESLLKYKDMDLVRHENFFWGQDNSPVVIEIDGEKIAGFIRYSGYQVVYKGGKIKTVIEKLKKGKILKICKHFWDDNGEKRYPKFSLIGFTNSFSKTDFYNDKKFCKEFPLSGLRCKKKGSRRIVWINTSHGSYALNGQAITWVESAKRNGTPIIGSDGKAMKIGRDYMPTNKLSALINEGLKKCD